MVVRQDQPIAMPRPFGGDAPTITVSPRTDGKPGSYITVQITGAIKSPYQFLEFIQVLDMATKDDVIDVVLDTPGGCVFTTQVLLERMNSSKATVTAVASGLVASAGTFLWFFSKHRKVEDWSTFMFHSSSHGDYGKSLSIQETSTEMVKYMHKTVKAMIDAGILTAEEATRIFRQKKDLFLPGSIIRARMMAEMASTEGLRLRDEADSDDQETDPTGTPDQDADDTLDGDTTQVGGTDDAENGEAIPLDPAAIFRAEGVEPETSDDDGAAAGDDDGAGDDGASAKCGKKKAKKRKAKAEQDGETIETDENGDPIVQPGQNEDSPAVKRRKAARKAAKKRRAKAEGDVTDPIPDGAETADADDDSAVKEASADAYLKW